MEREGEEKEPAEQLEQGRLVRWLAIYPNPYKK